MDTQQKTLDWGMQYERNRRATSALREYLVALAHHQQTMIDSREPTLKPWDIRRTINGGRTQEACPLSTAGLTIFNGQRNYQIPLPCTNRYCHSCRDTERKNIMARTLYALEDQKLINKPFYMLTLTVSGSWRKYEDRYQWKSRIKYSHGFAVDDVKSLVLWLCQEQQNRDQGWEVRTTIKEVIRDQYTVEYSGITSRSDRLPSNVSFAEGVLRYVKKRFGKAALPIGFRYLLPVYQQALSLIHISEPTRPY